MKILSVIGARPQFVKAALVSKRMREMGTREILVHTGQHYDFSMSEIFFRELNLPKPDYYLGIGSGSHGEQTGKMLIELEKVLFQESPDAVLVYGDTNTTIAGALVSAKLHIPIAHIEAGLRSYNKGMPEEINRILTDHCSDMLFCPTETAVKNLQKEGFTNIVEGGRLIGDNFSLPRLLSVTADQRSYVGMSNLPFVINVGDVMFDIALEMKKKVEVETEKTNSILRKYHLQPQKYILVTIHRADNTDKRENLQNIVDALREIAGKGFKILFPIHPRTRKALEKFDLMKDIPEYLIISDPISYIEMITSVSNASVVITDSGGLQKESYFFKVPCIIPRDETEWTELVDAGWNKVVGAIKSTIVSEVLRVIEAGAQHRQWEKFYGDGNAGEKVARVLLSYIKQCI